MKRDNQKRMAYAEDLCERIHENEMDRRTTRISPELSGERLLRMVYDAMTAQAEASAKELNECYFPATCYYSDAVLRAAPKP